MLFGPVFSAEMVTTARRARHYFVRLAYAGFLFAMLWSGYESYFGNQHGPVPISRVADFANYFFVTFSITQLVALIVLAPAMTAGTIALERERRTIEYLFATDLSNGEIVLGKLSARLAIVLCQILGGLPILALAMLMGGIEPEKLTLVFVVALSTTIALAAFGICVSVWSPRARDAVGRAYLLLITLLFLPLSVYIPSPASAWLEPFARPLLAGNPIDYQWRLLVPMANFVNGPWADAFTLLIAQGIFTAVCTVSAVAGVRRVYLKAAGAGVKTRKGRRFGRRRPVSDQPLLWKECYIDNAAAKQGVAGRVAIFLIIVAVIGYSAWQFIEALGPRAFWSNPAQAYLAYAVPMGTFLASLCLLVVAARASGTVTVEKDRDTWASLLCTDLSAGEIVFAKVAGNLYALRFLLVTPLLVYLPALLLAPEFFAALLFIAGTFLVLCCFVTTLGVLLSLKSRNTLRSMSATLSLVFFVGGGYLLCCCVPLAAGGTGRFEEVLWAACMPFLLVVPGAFYETIGRTGTYASTHMTEMLGAYFVGTFAYAVAAALLYATCVSGFDDMAGRVSAWQRLLAQNRPGTPSGGPGGGS